MELLTGLYEMTLGRNPWTPFLMVVFTLLAICSWVTWTIYKHEDKIINMFNKGINVMNSLHFCITGMIKYGRPLAHRIYNDYSKFKDEVLRHTEYQMKQLENNTLPQLVEECIEKADENEQEIGETKKENYESAA